MKSPSFIIKALFFFDICPFVCGFHFKNIFKNNVVQYKFRIKKSCNYFN